MAKGQHVPFVASPQEQAGTCAGMWFLMRCLPAEVLQTRILSFLNEEELTFLSWTCQKAHELVRFHRGNLPHVTKEQVGRHKMQIDSIQHIFPFFEVSRTQEVRFLLQTELHGIVEVSFCFWNYLWTEINRVYHNDTEQVFVYARIVRKKVRGDGSVSVKFLYDNGFDPHPGDWTDEGEDNNMDLDVPFKMRGYDHDAEEQCPAVIQNIQACTKYISICANRVAKLPHLPNVDLLLEQSLPEKWHDYLLPYKIDPVKAQMNPKLGAIWKYRVPLSSKQCTEFFQKPKRTTWEASFDIYELPWYRDWYPKPVELVRSNLIGSLPTQLLSQVVGYLNEDEIFALSAIYPCILEDDDVEHNED
jgi:hypothetical protein